MKRLGAIASALVLSTAVASPLAAQTAIGSLGNTKGITITGEVSEVFGNEFVLSDDSGRVLVETGPSWYRSYDFTVGERLTVIGEPDDDNEFEAYSIQRENGETIRIREADQRPPWAGERERSERRPVDDRVTNDVVKRFEDAGFTNIRFEEADGAHLEFEARSTDGRSVDIETTRDGRLHKLDVDDGEIELSALSGLLPNAVFERLRSENYERIEEIEMKRRHVEIEGTRPDGTSADLRFELGDPRRGEGARADDRGPRDGERPDERRGDLGDLQQTIRNAGFRLEDGEAAKLRAGGSVKAVNPYQEEVTLGLDADGRIVSEQVVR